MRLELLEKFETVVQQYHRDILNFLYRMAGNRAEAEDLAQETFIKAYQKFDSLEEPDKVKSWLFRIARNVAIDFFRKNKNKTIPLDYDMLDHYTYAVAADQRFDLLNAEISQELQKCIAELATEDRMIVKLLYYEGFSYKEIGILLNINPNTLKSRLYRARQALLALVQANELLSQVALEYR